MKSFAAEARESERYDRALASYANAAVRANTSLVVLNVVQSLIMNVGPAGDGDRRGLAGGAAGRWGRATSPPSS